VCGLSRALFLIVCGHRFQGLVSFLALSDGNECHSSFYCSTEEPASCMKNVDVRQNKGVDMTLGNGNKFYEMGIERRICLRFAFNS